MLCEGGMTSAGLEGALEVPIYKVHIFTDLATHVHSLYVTYYIYIEISVIKRSSTNANIGGNTPTI